MDDIYNILDQINSLLNRLNGDLEETQRHTLNEFMSEMCIRDRVQEPETIKKAIFKVKI